MTLWSYSGRIIAPDDHRCPVHLAPHARLADNPDLDHEDAKQECNCRLPDPGMRDFNATENHQHQNERCRYYKIADMAARKDYHGGIAPQSIVCALMQGPESAYALGAEISEAMWSPIIKTHRVAVEQLAILEPGLSEVVAMPFVDVMAEAVDECAAKYGIPREAAFDFLIGHLNVELAMWFGFSPKAPSDAALRLMRFAKGVVVRDDWRGPVPRQGQGSRRPDRADLRSAP